MNSTVFTYQFRLLVRNRLFLLCLLALLGAGIYSTYYGRHFVEGQQRVLAGMDSVVQDRYESYQAYRSGLPDSLRSDIRAYAGLYVTAYAPTAFTALAIGQKDNYPFYHEVNGLKNIYEVDTTTIKNPAKQLAGNFDLSFVIVYLFPLFVIVLGYNVLSEEQDQHTFSLLAVQTDIGRLVRSKLFFRLLVMLVLSLVVNLTAFAINGIPLRMIWAMVSWCTVSWLYIIFWFSLVYLVVMLDRGGSVSALLLGGLWVLFLLVIPTVVNRQVSSLHVREQAQTLFNRRGDLPRAYDLSEQEITSQYANLSNRHNLPVLSDTSALQRIMRKSYMVGRIQADWDNRLGRNALEATFREYQRALDYNWVNPAFAVQQCFNQIGNTEIVNYRDYMLAVEHFENERAYWLYRLWNDPLFDGEKDLTPKFTQIESHISIRTIRKLWSLLFISIGLWLIAITRKL